MGFKVGNTYGKHTKRGKDNKSSRIRKMFAEIVEENIENAKERMQELDNPQFFKAMGMMLRHILPAQKQVEMDVTSNDDEYQEEIIRRLDLITEEQAHDLVVGLADDASKELKRKRDVQKNE